jgi:dienelactone hydrolase
MRKALLIGLGGLGIIVVVLLIWKFVADATYFNSYDPKAAFNVTGTESQDKDQYRRVKLYFEGNGGEKVPTILTFPKEFTGKLPCVVFLHGIGQKKEFIDEITAPFNLNGFAMATFDQSMQGERDVNGILTQAVAFRQRPYKTINETRRLIDYLSSHPDIDPERIYLVGASYGAITGSTAMAFDKRIKAGVLVYGGGNISKLLSAPLIKEAVGWKLAFLRPIVAFIMRPADPCLYVKGISPRPVLFQNGTNDTLVCPEAAKALQEAAGEPKEIIWYDSNHPGLNGPRDEEIVRKVLDDGLKFLLKQDASYRKSAEAETKAAA